jgi:uncharacterized membrane protein YfcA
MYFSEFDTLTFAVIAIAFVLGGVSKGVVGFGLPLIAVPICASVVPVPLAIALTAAPVLISNVYQAFHGRRHGIVMRRFWPFLVTLVVGVLLGAQVLTRADHGLVAVIVGTLLLIFVVGQFFDFKPNIPSRAERRLNPFVGLLAGLLGGVSSMFGSIAVTYLVALRMHKDLFISSIGIFYLFGNTPLYGTLIVTGVMGRNEIIGTILVCLPLCAGLWLGTWLRGRISQVLFQRVLLVGLAVISLNLIRRGLM